MVVVALGEPSVPVVLLFSRVKGAAAMMATAKIAYAEDVVVGRACSFGAVCDGR